MGLGPDRPGSPPEFHLLLLCGRRQVTSPLLSLRVLSPLPADNACPYTFGEKIKIQISSSPLMPSFLTLEWNLQSSAEIKRAWQSPTLNWSTSCVCCCCSPWPGGGRGVLMQLAQIHPGNHQSWSQASGQSVRRSHQHRKPPKEEAEKHIFCFESPGF